eukprot:CAMPEP_0175121922 /NCGR_PEP_ID=MMETSP0087-20121206/1435_1 /TAXON_ID=136419 /ORGANISM="Unknown Unknown, Strain D1" /LENGTH=423 /DNA_ID=CAMNT_0016403513 /DNA_START=149 /DNA_END=1421 /DNA_ORIENTATION=-
MTEGLADTQNQATNEHCNLYREWSKGGAGLLLTGNVQIDRRYMERPGNVAIDGLQSDSALKKLRQWAAAATTAGNHCWVQISHAGRQNNVLVCKEGVAPSAVSSKNAGGILMPSWTPRALELDELPEIVRKFAYAARVCKDSGFTGVQIHSAHGYLLSSFLNPLCNQRVDEYGGSVENRAKLLLEVFRHVRAAVGPEFPVSVKLNSSDFQKGGFTHEEAMRVAELLDAEGVDLLEISGGNYENPALIGGSDVLTSSSVREAYFIEYARDIRKRVKKAPLMVTGGMRSRTVMEQALSSGCCEVIGVGRPLCAAPYCVKELLASNIDALPRFEHDPMLNTFLLRGLGSGWWKLGNMIKHGALQMWYYRMLILLGQGKVEEVTQRRLSYGAIGAFLFMDSFDSNKAKALKGLHAKAPFSTNNPIPC